MQIQLGCKYKKKGNVPVLGQQAGAKVQAQWGSRAARARSRSMDTPPADARTPHAPESVFKNEYGLKNSFDDQLDHTTIYAYERTHTRMSKWPKHTAIWCSRMHTYTYACEPMSKSMRRYYNYTYISMQTRTHKQAQTHAHTNPCTNTRTHACAHAHTPTYLKAFSFSLLYLVLSYLRGQLGGVMKVPKQMHQLQLRAWRRF